MDSSHTAARAQSRNFLPSSSAPPMSRDVPHLRDFPGAVQSAEWGCLLCKFLHGGNRHDLPSSLGCLDFPKEIHHSSQQARKRQGMNRKTIVAALSHSPTTAPMMRPQMKMSMSCFGNYFGSFAYSTVRWKNSLLARWSFRNSRRYLNPLRRKQARRKSPRPMSPPMIALTRNWMIAMRILGKRSQRRSFDSAADLLGRDDRNL